MMSMILPEPTEAPAMAVALPDLAAAAFARMEPSDYWAITHEIALFAAGVVALAPAELRQGLAAEIARVLFEGIESPRHGIEAVA